MHAHCRKYRKLKKEKKKIKVILGYNPITLIFLMCL